MADQSKKDAIMNLIYNEVNSIIGAGNQLFCMQMPAQALNYRRFVYDTDDRNSVLTKPYTVAEAEFRIADQMFDVAPIVQGPNGEKLSILYNTLINNYVPKVNDLAPFFRDRAGLSRFLLEPSDEKDENGEFISRMKLTNQLYEIYLEAKNQWEKEKNREFEKFRAQDNLDGYAKWMTSEGLVREEKLNNLYNDVIVRGHLHEVMTLLGYINSSSTAEELEMAKQRLRHSARLSLDESMLVYPVQFQPSNWFQALSPNLQPEDLTMAKDVLSDQFREKRKQLERAKSRLTELELFHISDEELNKLENEIEQAKKAMNEAESALFKQYGASAVTAAKVYLAYKTKGKTKPETLTKASIEDQTLKKLGLVDDDVNDKILDLVKEATVRLSETHDAQQATVMKAEELTELRAKKANAEAHDMGSEKVRLGQRIRELEGDVEYLGRMVAGTHAQSDRGSALMNMTIPELTAYANTLTPPVQITKTTKAEIVAEINANSPGLPVLPKTKAAAEVDGMFMDVVIKNEKISAEASTLEKSSDSSTSWNVSLGFASAGGKHSKSSAMSDQEKHFLSKEMEIGFRVAKVTFDRGGWFNPSLFNMSNSFFQLADLKAGAGITKEDVLEKRYDIKEKISKDNHMLPAFPVAMVIAKDITFKIKMSKEDSKVAKSVMSNSSSAGGGFLFFSVHSASSSKNMAESSFHGEEHGYYYIRIPGPQILGYYLQFVQDDKSCPYEPMFVDDQEMSPLVKALNEFTFNSNGNEGSSGNRIEPMSFNGEPRISVIDAAPENEPIQ